MATPEDQIRGLIRHFASPPDAELDELIRQGRRALLPKGEALVRIGEVDQRIAFLHTGAVRYHVLLPETGQDISKDFAFAPSLAVSFAAAVNEEPAQVAVSALVDCAVTLWPFKTFRAMVERHREWERFARKIAEMLYVRKERRELSFLRDDAARRYRNLLAEFPAAHEVIPQHMIASYLGIEPESLSRLKRRLGSTLARTAKRPGVRSRR